MIEWVVDQPGLRLGLGDSVHYDGDADLVFSHLYGPLPKQLIGKPAIVNVFGDRREQAERWCGAELHEVSKWGRGLTNTLYVANACTVCLSHAANDGRLDLTDLVEEEFAPGRGWFPVELCRRVMQDPRGIIDRTVFDGFMGRGTVGKVAREFGMHFVGIDINPERVKIAQEYLGC